MVATASLDRSEPETESGIPDEADAGTTGILPENTVLRNQNTRSGSVEGHYLEPGETDLWVTGTSRTEIDSGIGVQDQDQVDGCISIEVGR